MRSILIWFVAVFTASVLSSVVGVVGWALNRSLLPPLGGGTFKLIIVPIAVVWIVVLGSVWVNQWIKSRQQAREARLKRNEERLKEVIEKLKCDG